MKTTSFIVTALVAGVLACSAGCKKKEEPMGPAQKAGAAIDQAGEKVGDKLKENLDKARATGDQVAEAAKAAGEKIEEATGEASKGLDKATDEVGRKIEKAGVEIQGSTKGKQVD